MLRTASNSAACTSFLNAAAARAVRPCPRELLQKSRLAGPSSARQYSRNASSSISNASLASIHDTLSVLRARKTTLVLPVGSRWQHRSFSSSPGQRTYPPRLQGSATDCAHVYSLPARWERSSCSWHGVSFALAYVWSNGLTAAQCESHVQKLKRRGYQDR